MSVPLREYLRTAYRPDRDYLDGEVRDRHLGERPHALLHAYFVRRLSKFETTCGVQVLTSPRLQVRLNHIRVPDVCVMAGKRWWRGVIGTPPLLCVEVLSSNEGLPEAAERISDYVGMGVRHVWVADPWRRVGYVYSNGNVEVPADGVLRVAGTAIKLELAALFAQLDR